MAMTNPRLEATQTTRNVPLPPQVQRASLKQNGARHARDQNGATPDFTRRTERRSLRPRPNGLEPASATPAKTTAAPVRTKKPSQDRTSAYGRTSNGRQFTVGNIGNGGRIYLRYFTCQLALRSSSFRVRWDIWWSHQRTGRSIRYGNSRMALLTLYSIHVQTHGPPWKPTLATSADPIPVYLSARYPTG